LDLSLLLGYQLARNWHGQINLITVVAHEEQEGAANEYLKQLIDLGRMPRHTQAIVFVDSFDSAVQQAPEADLSIFGLSDEIKRPFVTTIMERVGSSCAFVHDSGKESALV
jgi:hypothetical protein